MGPRKTGIQMDRLNSAWMRTALLAALPLSMATVPGCMAEPASGSDVEDWGDPVAYPDLGGAYANLTPLTGTCTFVTLTGVMTINGMDTAQTIIIGRRAVDSAILVNGSTCGSPAATATTLKVLNVNASMAGDQVLILDFINGLFATGTATARGINVDLGAGTGDSLRIRGTTGADVITFGATGISVNADTNRDMDHALVESFSVSLAGGADIFTGAGGAGTGGGFGTLVTVYGGDGADVLTGTAQADVMYGGEGNDSITGAAGADEVYGDAGDDTFLEGAAVSGDDVFDGGAGSDTVSYALRTTTVTVSVGDAMVDDGEAGEADDVQTTVEVVTGGTADDALTGDGGANTLNGGAGADTLIGGAGADVLNGGDGNDIFDEEAATSGADTFNGGAGTDVVDYSARTNDLTITMDGGMTGNDGEAMEADKVQADVEDCIGGAGNDAITGNASANVLTGGAGTDTLSGAAGNDTFDEDTADTDADIFNGGDGVDTVDYSARLLAITVTMDGVTADDGDTAGSEGDDVNADVENCLGGVEADTITGNASANDIDGGAEVDTIDGGAGADVIFGGAGNDDMTGGAGDDVLDGGAGDNDLHCGAGDDIAYNEGMGTRDADCEL
jgi:Ca2+-binding RTX toxin-like protein